MAKEYKIEVDGLQSIYLNGGSDIYNRKIDTYFCIPENGVNEETGIFTYICGFGGQADSNVCKKMRKEFADKHNLVTVQCNYFGYEFMQSADKIYLPDLNNYIGLNENDRKAIYENGNFNLDKFLRICSEKEIEVNLDADLSLENLSNFNDMGIMQALDNITAVLTVMNILYNNDFKFNARKNILYGNSQGAYLAYLMNRLAPKLFSLIIDNSAWLYPNYLKKNSIRKLCLDLDNNVWLDFIYMAQKVVEDKQLLNLEYLYKDFNNTCNIISYHGVKDELISCEEKKWFCNNLEKCNYNEIGEEKVDGKIFKSTRHGLDADFLELFNRTMESLSFSFEKSLNFDLPSQVEITTEKYNYYIDYEEVMPKVYIKSKSEGNYV